MQKLLTLLLLSMVCRTLSYHVLVVAPVPSRSHGALAKGIVDALLDAGHQVTWVSPFKDWKPHKNLKLIDVSKTQELSQGIDMTDRRATSDFRLVQEFGINITRVVIETEAVREILLKQRFDAVVTEWFFSDTDAGFGAVLKCPWILLSGMVLMPEVEGLVEDIRSIPTVPILMNDFSIPMGFGERVLNTLTFLGMYAAKQLDLPTTAARYESFFSPIAAARNVALPPFKDAYYNVSILLVNSHPSIALAPSLPPNVVNVAGYHIDEPQPLPKEIQSILDANPKGVIYFSMGSVLKSAQFPQELRQQLVSVLGGLPYTVLWKFEEEIQGLPKNIIVRKWWPQASVLAHPNIKLFITHGGMLSTLEAIQNGVPLLAIPVFGDQPSNAARAVRAGYAQRVNFDVKMGPELKKALEEMLNNDSYSREAKRLSKLFNKRPVHPRKLISHYIELAIESQGAYHLRSTSYLYPWYQRWMVDQILALFVVLFIVYSVIKKIFRALCGSKTVTANKGRKVKKN